MKTCSLTLPKSGAHCVIRPLGPFDVAALNQIDRQFPELRKFRAGLKDVPDEETVKVPDELVDQLTEEAAALSRHYLLRLVGKVITTEGQELRIVEKLHCDLDPNKEISPDQFEAEDVRAVREAVEELGRKEQAEAEPFPEPGGKEDAGDG